MYPSVSEIERPLFVQDPALVRPSLPSPFLMAQTTTTKQTGHGNSKTKTYPYQVWYFLACFIFLLTIINWTGIAWGYYRARVQRRRPRSAPGEPEPPLRGPASLWRLPSALAETFRAVSFRWTVPIGQSYTVNFADVFLTGGYIIICFVWTLINAAAGSTKPQPRNYANLAGNLSTLQFPLVVALAMKNNVLSFLTGFGHDKLIYLHRMTARVLLILIWIHGGGRATIGLKGKTAITTPKIRAGILSAVALTLLTIVSIRPVRRKAYEFFLIVHFVLAFTFVLAGYFHAAAFHHGQYLWPAILLWALDRFFRVLRVAIHFIWGKKSKSAEAQVTSPTEVITNPKLELLSTNFIRLTIPRPRFFRWSPGQNAYLSFPGITAHPLEAHPFTISSVDNESKTSDLTFLMKVHKGATKRLFNKAEAGTVRVLIDGPYSVLPALVGYDTAVFIAGGSGVAFTLPLFLDAIERSKRQGLVCRRLTFVWSIRNLGDLAWIQSELLDALRDLPSGLKVNVQIFVTGTSDPALEDKTDIEDGSEALAYDTASSSSGDHSGQGSGTECDNVKDSGRSTPNAVESLLALPMVKSYQGRVDLGKLMKDEVTLAKDVMSVNVCGSSGLATAVRTAIKYPRMMDILQGGPTISLYVESYDSN